MLFGMFQPELSRVKYEYYCIIILCSIIMQLYWHQYYCTIILCKNIVHLGAALTLPLDSQYYCRIILHNTIVQYYPQTTQYFQIGQYISKVLIPSIILHNLWILPTNGVHRCGTGGSMRACHAVGPGSIPSRDKFPGWGFFRVFPHL